MQWPLRLALAVLGVAAALVTVDALAFEADGLFVPEPHTDSIDALRGGAPQRMLVQKFWRNSRRKWGRRRRALEDWIASQTSSSTLQPETMPKRFQELRKANRVRGAANLAQAGDHYFVVDKDDLTPVPSPTPAPDGQYLLDASPVAVAGA